MGIFATVRAKSAAEQFTRQKLKATLAATNKMPSDNKTQMRICRVGLTSVSELRRFAPVTLRINSAIVAASAEPKRTSPTR
ncbi:hypothetical protein K239x_24990 [Planctomycetes bacterium K23_9]|uniref:Uncharacterized protein n=1 Tax=Stieleria marina TaxID=1930275 RepID=A0A517NTW1_9BACT|nr:hypothetical protein K239x_24990 [Planctomycetes bacterium K23_9]